MYIERSRLKHIQIWSLAILVHFTLQSFYCAVVALVILGNPLSVTLFALLWGIPQFYSHTTGIVFLSLRCKMALRCTPRGQPSPLWSTSLWCWTSLEWQRALQPPCLSVSYWCWWSDGKHSLTKSVLWESGSSSFDYIFGHLIQSHSMHIFYLLII